MANGAKTYAVPEEAFDEEPFTDHERAAAGLGPVDERDPRDFDPSARAARRRLAQADAASRDSYEAGEQQLRSEGGQGVGRKPLDFSAPKGRTRRLLRQAPANARQLVQPTANLVAGRAMGGGIASAVLGLVGYAIGANFLAGGWPQVKGWFGAKFENKPYSPASTVNPLPAAAASTAAAAGPAPLAPPDGNLA